MALSPDQLAAIDRTNEVLIETFSDRGPTKTIIWIVEIDGDVYVRSVRGEDGAWYQRVLANPLAAIHVNGERIEFRASHVDDAGTIETVDEALRAKYPAGGSLDRMTRDEVLGTTLRLDPID
ncbi:MAG: DUF2255 family protein [Acidimicrobiia bacterium]|jgi:hypothetical protein